jgi:hypothetical protein
LLMHSCDDSVLTPGTVASKNKPIIICLSAACRM